MLALFASQIQKFQGELQKGVEQTRTLELLTTGQAILISAQQSTSYCTYLVIDFDVL